MQTHTNTLKDTHTHTQILIHTYMFLYTHIYILYMCNYVGKDRPVSCKFLERHASFEICM